MENTQYSGHTLEPGEERRRKTDLMSFSAVRI